MTIEQIEERQAMEMLKYETAKKIRTLLNEARERAAAADWDEDEFESAILELVTEEE
ncbi:hypothetical protein WME98_49895 [Sorangium sp. So ce296]|uniref:hypothetical protein n=1 Tax=Sorangium sp. So ce296 TaxID=3133296 RepID=UPI003F5E7DAB